jgi:hypothetical protein
MMNLPVREVAEKHKLAGARNDHDFILLDD